MMDQLDFYIRENRKQTIENNGLRSANAELTQAINDVLRYAKDTVWVGECETLADRMVALGVYDQDVYEGAEPWNSKATPENGECRRVWHEGDSVFQFCSECGGMLAKWLDYTGGEPRYLDVFGECPLKGMNVLIEKGRMKGELFEVEDWARNVMAKGLRWSTDLGNTAVLYFWANRPGLLETVTVDDVKAVRIGLSGIYGHIGMYGAIMLPEELGNAIERRIDND